MIQEIEPKRYNNAYKLKKPGLSDYFLLYDDNRVLVKKEGEELYFPKFSDLGDTVPEGVYLFSVDKDEFYLFEGTDYPNGGPFEFYTVQQMRESDPRWMAFVALTGWQLNRWRKSNRFCSRCGAKLVHSDKERAYVCPECKFVVYPKISPAIIVAVTDGDRLLMINSRNAPPERFHLIAGFVEIGETLEQTVAREVMEEAGVRIKNIRYYKNQPWSLSDTLMVGFTAELDGDDTLTPHDNEISVAKWFTREEAPMHASKASIGGEMTGKFRDGTLLK